MNNWLNKLIDNYYKFLKDKTNVIPETGTGWAVISMPFIGPFNDTIEIYIKKENEKIILSDDGLTILNLELAGYTIDNSPERKELFNKILLTYDIQLKNNELITEGTENNFSQKMHNFISAIFEIIKLNK
jgi:hypothetical protein